MRQLKLNLTNSQQLFVELVDHPFIIDWAKKIVDMDMWRTEHVALGSESYDPDQFAKNLNTLYESLATIPDVMGCEVPECFPAVEEYNIDTVEHTQKWMNIIHRWCVYTMYHEPYVVDDVNITYGSIQALKSERLNATIGLLFKLNQQVHDVERTYKSPGSASFPCTGIYKAPYWDQGFFGDENGYAPRDDYMDQLQDLLTKDNYDVYIAKRILGKDYRESWLDADDPGCIDVVNVGDNLHYAFEVDPLNDLSSFYNSEEFAAWMLEHNKQADDITVGRIPVGNISNLGTLKEIEQMLTSVHIESLEFIE
jgi:hypothetical protein